VWNVLNRMPPGVGGLCFRQSWRCPVFGLPAGNYDRFSCGLENKKPDRQGPVLGSLSGLAGRYERFKPVAGR
jgi:hypothetical protein